ncbi:LysR family transcriptional regulator [Dactylosporangium vinaceum]|uniref:LysR family transcriptional regulator n=1 Tax=Dactylosporangium vinaceum TaxID=53362 RepID=A0ABV5MIQ1_9ACTN|nr:LysR family transcriptional regulator [Dactylosporangium vinaceum]UAB93796.1 LysR family transcriptional regulator [Dactylosporangium vinaceum]
MLDVTRLRVLVAVARHGSVTAAAAALHYAQPSVSHHLARLEIETGAQLVQRVGRGIRLTPAGLLLAERGEEILGRLDAAESELAEHSGLRAGRVRLAAFPSALGSFVPAVAARFAAAHPDVELQFVEAEPPAALRLLRSGDADLAVVFDYDSADSPGNVRLTPLFTEGLHLVTQPGREGALPDFARSRWIAGCERCRESLVRRCTAAGFEPDIAFTTDDYVAVQALVAAGLGVTILPDLALRAHRSPHVATVPLAGGERRVLAAAYGVPPDPPATARLLEFLADPPPPATVRLVAGDDEPLPV